MDKRYIISYILNVYDIDTIDIMNIIVNYNIEYSTNSNGIFINLSVLDDTIIDGIYDKLQGLIQSVNIDDTIVCPSASKTDNIPEIIDNDNKDELSLTPIDELLLSLSKQTVTI